MDNHSNQIANVNLNINIQSLSPKQLLCECLDLSTQFFKQLVNHFITVNSNPLNPLENPFANQKIDFSLLINYILDPNRVDHIFQQFLSHQEKGKRPMVKSWLFELKYLRNCWAHNENITYRLSNRGFDTLSMLFENFNGDKKSALFSKIEFYRKSLLILTAKQYLSE